MGFPLGTFTTQFGLCGEWWSTGLAKNIPHQRNLSESDLENEVADFPRFIVIESLEEVCLAKFSPFIIEKVISTRATSKTDKKTRNGNLLIEVDSRGQAENIKIENLSYDEMQSLLAWETQHFQRSYQE